LDKDEVRIALTYWYQNILNLQLPLDDETIKEFLKSRKTDMSHLIDAADKIDLNLTLVD
jgi:hypothetical protein